MYKLKKNNYKKSQYKMADEFNKNSKVIYQNVAHVTDYRPINENEKF